MATKAKATKKTTRKPAPKPVAKKFAKKVAKKIKKIATKPTAPKAKKVLAKPKKSAARSKKSAARSKKSAARKVTAHKVTVRKVAARKVTARKATGKMVRPAAVRHVKPPAKHSPPERSARPGLPPRKPAPAKATRRAPRSEERRALPHKAPARPSFQMNDYFDGNASPYPTLAPSRREILPVAVEWKEKMRPGELYQAFKRFFEANELGNRFIGSLREGAAAIVEFEGDTQSYKVVKVRGRALLELGRPASAEVYLKLSRHAVEAMLAPNATKPAEYVARVVALMAEPDPAKRIELKLLCTHGEAIRKGYLGVVAAGGKQLAEALLQLGHSLPQEFVKHLH